MHFFQVRIKVIDDAWPNIPQYGVLTVQVTRNRQGPQLQSTNYTRFIKASNPVGSNIVTIQASDPDGVSSFIFGNITCILPCYTYNGKRYINFMFYKNRK